MVIFTCTCIKKFWKENKKLAIVSHIKGRSNVLTGLRMG